MLVSYTLEDDLATGLSSVGFHSVFDSTHMAGLCWAIASLC